MQAVRYARPSSVEEAVELLERGGAGARVLAGGTDLIVLARERRIDVDLFVDVKALAPLTAIRYDPTDGLTIGAAAPCYRIAAHPAVQAHYPCLIDCATLIGGVAIQGRASLGGNLCNASPAGDGIPALIALGTTVEIAGPEGRRTVAAEQFCTGPGRNVLGSGEFVVALRGAAAERPRRGRLPALHPPRGDGYRRDERGGPPPLRRDRVGDARVAVGAVAPRPLLVAEAGAALAGAPLSEATIEKAAAAARAAARPIDDMRGTVKQRRHLAGVLVARCIRIAAERAGVQP